MESGGILIAVCNQSLKWHSATDCRNQENVFNFIERSFFSCKMSKLVFLCFRILGLIWNFKTFICIFDQISFYKKVENCK